MEISGYYGITRPDEERKYSDVKRIALNRVEKMKAGVNALAFELNELRDVYDINEKEGLAQWFNKDNRFREVREELQRAERAKKKPYFGRIDYIDAENDKKVTHYIGKSVIYEDPAYPQVIDWRAPIASIYYDQNLGDCRFLVPKAGVIEVTLERKRTYELDEEKLIDFFDSEVVANDELLTKYLSKSSKNMLGEIIATIQQEQNEVIRINPHHNVLIQGGAGSGKTTVAMHRISYILYNYDREFKPADFYIIGSNKMLLNYITGVLPDLDVYGIGQMTMEELFVRLLYEEWDPKTDIKRYNKQDLSVSIKGNTKWFDDLEEYCRKYLRRFINTDDIVIEKNGHVLMCREQIEHILDDMQGRTIKDIYEKLTDVLISHLETELYGRGLSYPKQEQKRLFAFYENYFSKKKIKASVYDIYDSFVDEELGFDWGVEVSYDKALPDLYDLACLAYIYKSLKETEVIREASHVVIDEAQDFGISIYRSLKYCLNKCTFTIMGDVSQNINFGCGLSDWEELKRIMLPNEYDYFGLLKKSYRNTIEIANFALDVLRHGSFPIYPVEPIIRHGEEVGIIKCDDNNHVKHIKDIVNDWSRNYDTIALICKDDEEATRMYQALADSMKNVAINRVSEDNVMLQDGLTILPIDYCKGLEFDAVIICNASAEAYPMEDGYAKLLYVVTTRALHELIVCHKGELTRLICDKVDKSMGDFIIEQDDGFHKKARVFALDERNRFEIAKDQSLRGDEDKSLRDKYGPKRSKADEPIRIKKQISKSQVAGDVRGDRQSSRSRINLKDVQQQTRDTAEDIISRNLEREVSDRVNKRIESYNDYIINQNISKKASLRQKMNDNQEKSDVQKSEFGNSPSGTSLAAIGHGKIDTSVRWIDVRKDKVVITSAYGNLYLIPINDTCVRVMFSRNEINDVLKIPSEVLLDDKVKWKCNNLRDRIELVLSGIRVDIDKKTGAVIFRSAQGEVLLSEASRLTRQYHEGNNIWWNYLNFEKKEIIKAVDPKGIWIDVSGTAKYISSFDNKSIDATTVMLSMKGYRILIPSGNKILLNTIVSSNPFIKFEGADKIDYLFQTVVRKNEK